MAEGIYARGKDTWRIAYDGPRGPDGGRNQLFKTFKGTQRQAIAERRRLLREIDTGSYVEPSRLTVSEFLEKWLNDYAKTNVRPRTFQRYEEIVRCHLSPALGH